MKKLGLGVVGATALCAVLAFSFVGCSNSAGGNSANPPVNPVSPANPVTPVNNESKILDLRIKKNGVAYVNQNASQNLVSKSVTTGYDESLFTGNYEVLQSEHVKIEKVSNGLKFTITRPEADCFDSTKYKEVESYSYVGPGKGSYEGYLLEVEEGQGNLKFVYRNVGQGNGTHNLEDGVYVLVGQGNGSYILYLINVGEGNGNLREEYKYVGPGKGTDELVTKKIYGGWGYTAIYREEKINGQGLQTTCAVLSNSYSDDKVECFYPLCEEGDRYVFKVQFDPADVNTYRDDQRYEWLVVNAEGGIGDIDYSNINEARWCNLTYDGTTPTAKIFNCIPPNNADNVKPFIIYFATDSTDKNAIDWETPNATKWIYEYEGKSQNDDELPKEVVRYFTDLLFASGKERFFAQYFYTFEVKEASGIKQWRTAGIDSQIVSFR